MDWLAMDGETITLASMALGAVVWALRVESRVNVLTSRYEDTVNRLIRIEKLIDQRFGQLITAMDNSSRFIGTIGRKK